MRTFEIAREVWVRFANLLSQIAFYYTYTLKLYSNATADYLADHISLPLVLLFGCFGSDKQYYRRQRKVGLRRPRW
jgi:hypothetical protein